MSRSSLTGTALPPGMHNPGHPYRLHNRCDRSTSLDGIIPTTCTTHILQICASAWPAPYNQHRRKYCLRMHLRHNLQDAPHDPGK